MSKLFWKSIHTELADFSVAVADGAVERILLKAISIDTMTDANEADDQTKALLNKACQEISEYIAGKRKIFDLPIRVSGTPFRLRIWKVLQKIPYGSRVTYGGLAKLAGCPRAARAVGNAMHANRIPLIIPCHRVVANNGIGGYGGVNKENLNLKQKLLDLEAK